MSTDATLTSKGQTTIPKAIRDSLRMKAGDKMSFTFMKAGDKMSFTLMPDGVVIMRVKNRRVSDLAGLLTKRAGSLCPLSCCRGDGRSGHQRPYPVFGAGRSATV
jgi:AbrB family looped-hinge helix DNA binding protein